MLRLITAPIRIGLSLTGRAVGVVRSVVSGSQEDDWAADQPPTPAPRSAHASPPASATAEPAAGDGAATDEHPTRRDPSASDWDEDAPVAPGGSDPDDLIVLDRVKTEIFRPGDAEKGSVNVNVENGVVYLRGDVDDPAQAEYFEVAAAGVEGVVRVENLIGTSGGG
ncbi:MAG TPA: BON domain-containing protein [Solirubrobacterales bacterium]|nr:BON domain-containing protein [Solirubrobacterales bacterium]